MFFVLGSIKAYSIQKQSLQKDSTSTQKLEEVLVIAASNTEEGREKPLSNIESYLSDLPKVDMIKRGGYAWEPVLNNMNSDRLNISIDGMMIFGACTDKMDPVTSYVSLPNLDHIDINSGQNNSELGTTIGGSMNLSLKKGEFNDRGWDFNLLSGYDSNGNGQNYGFSTQFQGERFYALISIDHKSSENYKAGGQEEILYSGFHKNNLYTSLGYKFNPRERIEALFIYDRATDVGYPALPMDVALARGIIGSTTYTKENWTENIKRFQVKLYANSVYHLMDDSARPDVPIRMDMPGWTETYGANFKLGYLIDQHNLNTSFNTYYNHALAEMTMFPNDPDEIDMFMYTWPDVGTLQSSLYLKDSYALNDNTQLEANLRLAYQSAYIKSDVGYNSLAIIYPNFDRRKNYGLYSFSFGINHQKNQIEQQLSIGSGSRAPNVSEAYGYFLFNSSENFDYIGNPNLDTENSFNLNYNINMEIGQNILRFEQSYFYTEDYIIGQIAPDLTAMTIGAQGVKVYQNIDYTNIYNANISLRTPIGKRLEITNKATYALARDNQGENLPWIAPLTLESDLNLKMNSWGISLNQSYNFEQKNHGATYGGTPTEAYYLMDISGYKNFDFQGNYLKINLGIENILDKSYSSYSSWNNLQEPGRNLFINLNLFL